MGVKCGLDNEKIESGFTKKTLLAMFYAIFVFQPAVIWLYLKTADMTILGSIAWTTLMLFAEMSRMFGTPLTKQEAAVISITVSSVVGSLFIVMGLLYNSYFVTSPAARMYNFADYVPPWCAPPINSPVYKLRTFFHPDWTLSVAVTVINFFCILTLDAAMGLIAFKIFVKEEKLPFPMAEPVYQAATVLTEREPEKLRFFIFSSLVALIFSFVQYGVPLIAEAINLRIQTIPVPWWDLSGYVQQFIPGATFAIGTNLLLLGIGLLIPFKVALSMFIGAFGLYFIGNSYLVSSGMTQFAKEYSYGMSAHLVWERSILHAWGSPIIGFTIAAGLIPLLMRPQLIINTFKGLRRSRRSSSREIAVFWPLVVFLVTSLVSVGLSAILVPSFPVWILALSIGWAFVGALFTTMALGVTGYTLDIRMLNVPYITYTLSGYEGYDIYFTTPATFLATSAAAWCQNFYIAEQVNLEKKSFIKLFYVTVPISIFFAFICLDFFWRMSPIPSEMYPGVMAIWPTQAAIQSLWISRRPEIFRVDWILISFLVGTALTLVSEFANLPISTISIAVGMGGPLPNCLTIFIGAIISKIIARFMGKERFCVIGRARSVIVAGLSVGTALPIVIGASISMIMKSTWIMRY